MQWDSCKIDVQFQFGCKHKTYFNWGNVLVLTHSRASKIARNLYLSTTCLAYKFLKKFSLMSNMLSFDIFLFGEKYSPVGGEDIICTTKNSLPKRIRYVVSFLILIN